jgi:signal recognition particle subunit SRP19
LDRGKSRKEGRMIAKRYSILSPTIKEIADAAEVLRLDPIVEADKAYPRSWWETSGRVCVTATEPKTSLMKELALIIAKNREK